MKKNKKLQKIKTKRGRRQSIFNSLFTDYLDLFQEENNDN